MAVPNRPADETTQNVGKRYGPPQDTSTAPDNNFAGTSYVTGCSGDTATNKSQPGFRYVLNNGQELNSNNLTVTESDGTVKQYFVSGNESTTDTYFTNPGLTESKYNALSASQKALYCDGAPATGGVITGVSITDSGEYIATASAGAGSSAGNGDASFNLTYGTRTGNFGQSKYLQSVTIKNGGTGYKVGDTFSVAGVDFSPSIQQPAKFQVTSATPITGGGGTRYLKDPSPRVREVSRPLGVRIWNPTADEPDPTACEEVGKTLREVTVTGSLEGEFYGCGPYKNSSNLAKAAVHAGLLAVGETGKIRVKSANSNEVSSWSGGCIQNGAAAEGGSGPALADCAITLELVSKTSNDGAACDPRDFQRQEQITVDQAVNGGDTRGGVARVQLMNPYPRPKYIATLPDYNINGGQKNNQPDTPAATNWIFSCPGFTSAECNDITTQNYLWTYTGGPSNGQNTTGFNLGYKPKTFYNINDFKGCFTPNCYEPSGNTQGHRNFYVYDLTKDDALGFGAPPSDNRGSGWAIGDTFELRPTNSNDEFFDDNFYPKIKVVAITDAENTSPSTMNYTVQNNFGIKYNQALSGGFYFNLDDIVVSVDTNSTSDNLLADSALSVIALYDEILGRPPKKEDFEQYVRQVYSDDGNTNTARNQIRTRYDIAIDNNIRVIETKDCGYDLNNTPSPSPVPSPAPSPPPGPPTSGPPTGQDTNCKYDRNDFYRGTNGTTNGQVDLYEIWGWLGSPKNNPNPICPRPENDSGLVQDDEPDMTDFAGLKIQRWQNCNGSDIGTIVEEFVPCTSGTAGQRLSCTDPTTADNLAVYDRDSKVCWNNGDCTVGNFVKETLNVTAEAINNKYKSFLGRPAEQAGLKYWYDDVVVKGIPLNETLKNIEAGSVASGESALGGVASFSTFCEYANLSSRLTVEEGLSLSYFIDTRIAPWWGDQELAAPSLTMTKSNDNIYMVNIPPTQNTTYTFKATPTVTASGKKFFSVAGNMTFPSLTGTPTPGEPVIVPGKIVEITWYKAVASNGGAFTGQGYFYRGEGITNLQNNIVTVTGSALSGTSGSFTSTLTIDDAKDGTTSNPEALDYNETGGDQYFCLVNISNKPENPKNPGTLLPGFGGDATNSNYYTNFPSRFLLNNIDCQDATIQCAGNGVKEVKTNEPTTITFSMNISTNCLQYRSGTAKISIRRFWPCPVFGPAPKERNQWVVQKQTVAIPQSSSSTAQISYNLSVNTDKTDYLAGEDGVDVAPGDCHWVYYAYWEIDYPGVACRSNAWSNPGCNCGTGLNQLDEIFCLQEQSCANACSGGSGPSGPSGCQNDTDIPDSMFDFSACLPLCSSESKAYFYWYYKNAEPGVNCSGPTNGGSNPSPNDSGGPEPGESPYGPGCECPICEQNIMVRVLEGTTCGILGLPRQAEGADLGPNTGAVDFFDPRTGTYRNGITNYTSNPVVLDKEFLQDCNPDFVPGTTPDDKCLAMGKATWVFLPRKTFDTLTTLGNDAAIRIIDYDKAEVDCDETVFTQASYYYEKTFKNGTTSGVRPLPVYLGGPDWDGYLRKYNPSAGTNTEAMGYYGEKGISSKKAVGGFIDVAYDLETTKSMKIFVNVTSTNDYFGNVQYHPPPRGFLERDFGTIDCVQSPRGAAGGTPIVGICRDLIPIAHFSVADKQNVPVFKEPTGITCPTGDVPFEGKRLTPDIFDYCCDEDGRCLNYGVSFACQGACDSGGCDLPPLPGPSQEVVFCATSGEQAPPPTPSPTPGPSGPQPGPGPIGPGLPPNPGPFNPPGVPFRER